MGTKDGFGAGSGMGMGFRVSAKKTWQFLKKLNLCFFLFINYKKVVSLQNKFGCTL